MKTNILKKQVFVLPFMIALLFCSCQKEATEQETSFFDLQGENGFIGVLEGTNAFVAILMGEEKGVVYVCDGAEGISEWFRGTISNPMEVNFTNPQGAEITASLNGNSFEGQVSFKDGRSFPFRAPVNSGINGGIYKVLDEEAEEVAIEATWIVQSEEDQRGFVTTQTRQLPTVILSEQNFKAIRDETSNTISINGKSFSLFRYQVKPPQPPALFVPTPFPNTSGSG